MSIQVGMLVVNKDMYCSSVYSVLRIDADDFVMVQVKDSGRVTFKLLDTLQQASIEQYKAYGYDFAIANDIVEVTPYELTNFLIWIKSECRRVGIDTLMNVDMTDTQCYELAKQYMAFKGSKEE